MILPLLVFIVVLIAILYTHFKQKPEQFMTYGDSTSSASITNQVTSSASTSVTNNRSDRGKTYLSFLLDKNIVNPPEPTSSPSTSTPTGTTSTPIPSRTVEPFTSGDEYTSLRLSLIHI